jgi:hypothetical protein
MFTRAFSLACAAASRPSTAYVVRQPLNVSRICSGPRESLRAPQHTHDKAEALLRMAQAHSDKIKMSMGNVNSNLPGSASLWTTEDEKVGIEVD